MTGRPTLESVLYDIQAEVRVLDLLADAEDDMSMWSRYGVPREDGFDLMRVSCRDALAVTMTLRRLQKLADLAIAAFHDRT